MTDSELKEMEASPEGSTVDDVAVEDDVVIEVIAKEGPSVPKPIVPIGLAGSDGPDAFDNSRPRPTVWHEGRASHLNLHRHIGLSLRPAVRQKLDDLIGKPYDDIKPTLTEMLDAKEIDEVQVRRLAQPVPAEAEPGTIFVIVNTDNTVNSVHMG